MSYERLFNRLGVLALFVALGVITFVPDFVLWLPRLLGYKG